MKIKSLSSNFLISKKKKTQNAINDVIHGNKIQEGIYLKKLLICRTAIKYLVSL